MVKFTRVSPDSGDWEAWYMDGKLIAEGHRVRVVDILNAINDVFTNKCEAFYIDDEKAEMGFTKELSDMF